VTESPSEAFALFFKHNSGPVFRALFAGTGDRAAAEDATAETFARAFAHWDTVAVHPNPRAWVLRVAWNWHRSSWRKWEGRWSADPPEATPPNPEPWSDPDLVAAIRALPSSQREVIVLVALGELTPTQASRRGATVPVHGGSSSGLSVLARRRRARSRPTSRRPIRWCWRNCCQARGIAPIDMPTTGSRRITAG
jgi:DNA-directed RNA polymerase specialized sigma24 family protein